MTRKEVCKATGLSIKTLRLYEEKGLIAPEKEWRNGREYREYTPELVSQLNQIVTLRRALFTMDEIREMQTQPDRIFSIFQDYRTWLSQQEQQLKKLRAAADRVSAESLSDLDGLVSGLQDAAADMPLPALDIKPNFKRLDELDEGPRHVEPQVNLDDMVPSATVFRQVNIMVDRDRGNDANLALGQLQATVRGFQEERGSGPVRGKQTAPKWRRILSGVLTALLPVLLILVYLSRAEIAIAGVLFWVDLGLLALLWAIPAWTAHRKWLKNAQQADAENTSPEAYQRARKRRILILAASLAGLLILGGGIYLLSQVLYTQAHPDMDYRVCLVSPAHIPENGLCVMEQVLTPLVGDRDGNGEAQVSVDLNHVKGAYDWTLSGGLPADTAVSIEDFLAGGPYPLILVANVEHAIFDLDRLEYARCCRRLPDDLTGETLRTRDAYRVKLTGCPMLKAAGLEELTVYGCISGAATEEEYALAAELLRKLLEG